jgi:hypothetical protein
MIALPLELNPGWHVRKKLRTDSPLCSKNACSRSRTGWRRSSLLPSSSRLGLHSMSVSCRELSALCLLAVLSLGALPAAHADDGRGRDRGERADRGGREREALPTGRRQRQQDALSDSVRRIERTTRGQVLSAERVPYDGRDINRIKVVDDRGRVRVYMDDPQSRRPSPRTRGDDD